MKQYEVGKVIPEFKGKAEAVYANIDDSGIQMMAIFNAPTNDEVDQFESSKPFEIRLTEVLGEIIFTIKIGNLAWMDAPYSPHLSAPFNLQAPEEGQGYGLMLLLVDGATGILKHIRLIGLSTRFSNKMKAAIEKKKKDPFDQKDYYKLIDTIFSRYTTREIADRSTHDCRCKI